MDRNLRIITGMVLYIFIAGHLINVALGFFSAELIETARPYFAYVWSTKVGAIFLLASLLTHAFLGLKTLYLRNTLQMTMADKLQFSTGFLILPLMIPHVWGVIAMVEIFNIRPTYPVLMQLFWIDNPLEGFRQVLLIMIVWIHGSIGIFTWLQLKRWWPRVAPFVYPMIVLVPVLSLLGFVEGGNLAISKLNTVSTETAQGAQSSAYEPDANSAANLYEKPAASDQSQEADEAAAHIFAENYTFATKVKWYSIFAYLGILVLVLIARYLRLAKQTGIVSVFYEDGTEIHSPVGKSFLELSKTNHVPHANLCRGRGRCGTCRIRIMETTAVLLPPSQVESEILSMMESDADIRLACQCVPGAGVVHIERLFQPDVTHSEFRFAQEAEFAKAELLPSTTGAISELEASR